MAERLYRAQILLEKAQHQILKEIARREDRSISDVAREAIRLGLRAYAQDQQAQKLAHENLRELRTVIRERSGTYTGDLVSDIREERDRQFGLFDQGAE
jgi:hypothetical protein